MVCLVPGSLRRHRYTAGQLWRIFYGLDRFSEDLDFSLETGKLDFDLASYFPVLEKEVRSFGLNVEIQEKKKTKESTIRSAFLKGSTKEHLLLFYADEKAADNVSRNEAVRIKLEVEVDPPAFATFEHKYRLLPVPYEVKMYDMPSLFAGKIHAVICRAWQSRIKGRDLYDYIFYLSRGAAVNQKYLRERLIDSKYIATDADCSLNAIKKMLTERFNSTDYVQVRRDVEPFIRDTSVLDVWSSDFFRQITDRLTAV